ncbi:MAG TPA: FHIPEP family type III secretion protein, partial [Spirochaetota bacterium]|nr:FHIPEP family type III secretion protein [Spirochaetota bacterium]
SITVDPEIETVIRSSIHDDPIEGQVLGLDPETHNIIVNAMIDAYTKAKGSIQMPVFLVSPAIRSVVFALLERELPDPVVLSYNEISPNVKVNVITSALISTAA